VPITAVCPHCLTAYNLKDALRGKSIRCPNVKCQKAFQVEVQTVPAAPASAKKPKPAAAVEPKKRSASVEEMVPMLPAEAADLPLETQSVNEIGEVGDLVPLEEAEPVKPAPEVATYREPPQVRGTPKRQPAAETPPPSPPRRPREAPTPAPAAAPSWMEPPPVRNPQGRSPKTADRPASEAVPPVRKKEASPQTRPDPEPATEPDNGEPTEMPPGRWDPPPVRRRGAEMESETESLESAEAPSPETEPDDGLLRVPDDELPAPPRATRWARRLIVVLLLLLIVFAGGGTLLYFYNLQYAEERLRDLAMKDYKEKIFQEAKNKFDQLGQKFPNSEHILEYIFLADLSDLRGDLVDPQNQDAAQKLNRLEKYIVANEKNPLFKQYGPDLGDSLTIMLEEFIKRSVPATSEGPLDVVIKAELLIPVVKSLRTDALPKAEGLKEGLTEVSKSVGLWKHRTKVIATLKKLPEEPPYTVGLKTAQRILRDEGPALPGLDKEEPVIQVFAELYKKHQESVQYREGGDAAPPSGRGEDVIPSMVIDPLLKRNAVPQAEGIFLALARGVLYALDRRSGQVRWVIRVGIDTTTLPVRVPRTAASPERILVLSADTEMLTALDEDGIILWKYRLSKPCLGRPVIFEQRAYLPTLDGNVHEIDLLQGKLIGRYELGQRLTAGGVRHGPKSNLVYFPADDTCVYVLDVEERRCKSILYSNHPSGSLRSEPLVVAPEGPDGPHYLVLTQTQGLDAMELRVFPLPINGRETMPLALKPAPRVAGWTWFPPYHDGEKVALLSDAGLLGLFGVRQQNNEDPALFSLLPEGANGLSLEPFLGKMQLMRSRAEIVHVAGNDFWVLAHGQLQRLQLAWKEAKGPALTAGWKAPLSLGSPLHASQVAENAATGRAILFLVTQPLNQQACLATAVDDETGQVLWQRQLGLVCQGEPVPLLTNDKDATPLLLVQDQGGGLMSFDPAAFQRPKLERWLSGSLRLADGLEENPTLAPVLLPASDGRTAYQVSCPAAGRQLMLRRIQPVLLGRRLEVREIQVNLPASLAGMPALVGTKLILPLDNGILYRLNLPQGAAPIGVQDLKDGPNWRLRKLGPEARAYVAALGPDSFLTTDGAFGVTCYRWPVNAPIWGTLPEGQKPPTVELTDRLATAPLVLPPTGDEPLRLFLAEAGGVLTLRAPLKSRTPLRSWKLKGRITAGPYLATAPGDPGMRIGVVVDGSRLVWIDPQKPDEPLWSHVCADTEIVGQPRLIQKAVLVCDQSGRYLALNPATGLPLGKAYTLLGSMAPAGTPTGFDSGRVLAPLSDGTVMIFGLDDLKK